MEQWKRNKFEIEKVFICRKKVIISFKWIEKSKPSTSVAKFFLWPRRLLMF